MKKILNSIVLILASVFFVGCHDPFLNPVYNTQSDTVTISGSIQIKGAVPTSLRNSNGASAPNASASRSAFSSMPDVVNYAIWAIDSTTEQKVKDATINLEDMNYELSLANGKSYYLCGSITDGANKEILSYKSEKITIDSYNPLIVKNVVFQPVVSEEGKGRVELEINATPGISLEKCIAVWNGNESQNMMGSGPYSFTMNDALVSSGSYDVSFRFFRNEQLVYEFTELINVFDNLTTNVWVKNGDETYFEPFAEGTICTITEECINYFTQHTFYVDSSNQNNNPSGTYYNPYRSFTDALAKANAIGNDGIARIYIKTTDNNSNIHTELISEPINAHINLAVETYVNIPGDGRGKAEFVVSTTDTMLTVGNEQNQSFTNIIFNGKNGDIKCTSSFGLITIGDDEDFPGNAIFKNCEFKNAATVGVNVTIGYAEFQDCKFLNNTGHNGGGLRIGQNTSVTLSGTTQINGNVAECGGGIYTAGTLTIKGNCLIGDSTFDTLPTEQNYANSAGYGAGIYAESPFTVDSDATLTLAGNFAESMGGGIFIDIGGTENLSSTNIKYCTAGEKGGGICATEANTILISSTLIEYCHSAEGGGIYSEAAAPVILTRDTVITNNTASYGSGVFVDSDVYNNQCLGMQDNAYVALNNEVYINTEGDYWSIYLSSNLYPPESNDYMAAKVRLSSYTEGLQLLSQPMDTSYIENSFFYFEVASPVGEDPSIEWYVTFSGEVHKKLVGEELMIFLEDIPTDTSKVYIIDDKEDLAQIATWVNAGNTLENITFKLNSDITINNTWTPIGNFDYSTPANRKPFKGNFDGNGKTVTFNSSSNALFDYAVGSEIKNVKTAGTFTPTSTKYTSGSGTVINYLKGGKLSNCENKATIPQTSASIIGGIIGKAEFSSDDRSCVVENCINTGNITSSSYGVGGVIGYARSVKVINCYNSGNITGGYAVGGIAGWSGGNNDSSPGTLGSLYENCGNVGTISASIPITGGTQPCGAGGIAGGNISGDNEFKPDFINCWSSGQITAGSNVNGGIFGAKYYRSFTNCTYRSGTAYGYGPSGASAIGTDSGNTVSSTNEQIVTKMNGYIDSNHKTDYKPWKVEGDNVVFDD